MNKITCSPIPEYIHPTIMSSKLISNLRLKSSNFEASSANVAIFLKLFKNFIIKLCLHTYNIESWQKYDKMSLQNYNGKKNKHMKLQLY